MSILVSKEAKAQIQRSINHSPGVLPRSETPACPTFPRAVFTFHRDPPLLFPRRCCLQQGLSFCYQCKLPEGSLQDKHRPGQWPNHIVPAEESPGKGGTSESMAVTEVICFNAQCGRADTSTPNTKLLN